MSSQVRVPGDNRWYNPDRDVIWSFPRVISLGLKALTDLPPERLESLGKTSKELAQLINACRDAQIKPGEARAPREQVLDRLLAMDQQALNVIARQFFFAYFGEFYDWCGEVAPRGPEDRKIDLEELRKTIELFSRAAVPGGGNDAATPS